MDGANIKAPSFTIHEEYNYILIPTLSASSLGYFYL